jgi:hypothetical protein
MSQATVPRRRQEGLDRERGTDRDDRAGRIMASGFGYVGSVLLPLATVMVACGSRPGFNADVISDAEGTAFSDIDGGDAEAGSCATARHAAELAPVDLVVMLDQSGSMGQTPFTDPTKRWNPVVQAIKDFTTDPRAVGMGMAIQYFPLNLCDVASYAKPDVPIQSLPGNAVAIAASLDAHHPLGGTPTLPALQGAVQYAAAWASSHPTHTVVVILATDGVPDGCDSTVETVSAAAASAVAAKPSIRTAVIGVGTGFESSLDQIAVAGGLTSTTGPHKYFPVEEGPKAGTGFFDALDKVRTLSLSCEYALPTASDPTVDPERVNVEYTPGNGSAQTTLVRVNGAADCASTPDGWYYDDPKSPSLIQLCAAPCTRINDDVTGHVDLVFGCKSKSVR